MLSIVRNIARYDRDIHSGTWHYTSPGKIPRAQNLTVGVLGLGRIGKRFAHYAQPIFKRVIAHDPNLIDGDFPQYVERVSVEKLFAEADAISIHCLLNEETRGLGRGRRRSLMMAGSCLCNTGRGAIADIDGLVRVLRTDRLAGVGLDVLPVERVQADHPLLSDPRVLLSPHSAFYSV